MTELTPGSIDDEPQPGEEPLPDAVSAGSFHFAEYVPLSSYPKVFGFMRLHMRLYKGAIGAPGYVAGGIRAKWWRKRFWTYWVWDSREAMRDYLSSSPAAAILLKMHALAGPGACNVEWTTTEAASWDVALERLRNPSNYITQPTLKDLF